MEITANAIQLVEAGQNVLLQKQQLEAVSLVSNTGMVQAL